MHSLALTALALLSLALFACAGGSAAEPHGDSLPTMPGDPLPTMPGDSLPTVKVTPLLAAPHTRYDGRDVQAGLTACARQGGCRLVLTAGVIDDVDIELGSDSPYGCRRPPCYPRGLVIEGQGPDKTTVRQTVPAGGGAGVFRIGRNPPQSLHFRGFACDGRKQEQPAEADWKASNCINISSPHLHRTDGGSIRDLHVRNFMLHGISVRDGRSWTIANNRIEDVGCDDLLTPCGPAWRRSNPACARKRIDGDVCPYQDPERWVPGLPHTTVAGHGIYLPGNNVTLPRDHVVRDNIVRRVTKSCITLYGGGKPRLRIEGVVIQGNEVSECGTMGISIHHHVHEVVVRDNVVRNAGTPDGQGAMGIGIGCATLASRLTVEGNRIETTQGEGMNLACALDDSLIRGNHVVDPCQGSNDTRSPGFGIDVGAMTAEFRGKGVTAVSDNSVTGAAGCRSALRIRNVDAVRVSGGRYVGGFEAVAIIESAKDIEFERGVELDAADDPGPGGVGVGLSIREQVEKGRIDSSTRIRGAARSVEVAPGGRVWVCQGTDDPVRGCH